MRTSKLSSLLVLAMSGCALEEAPPTLKSVFHDYWLQMADATDEELGRTLANTLLVVDVDALADGRQRGSHDRLTDTDVEVVEMEPSSVERDPAKARAVYILERYACTVDDIKRIQLHDDQNELYGTYVDYERTYFTDKRDWLDGDIPLMRWSGEILTSLSLFGEYIYRFRSDAREVPIPDDVDLPGDSFLLTRTWLPTPAEWTRGGGSFPQDFQLEVFFPVSDTEVVHLYPVWRQLEVPGAGDMEGDVFADFNVDQMDLWGDTTARLCAEGRP